MSDFGVWESIETSDSEKKIASRRSEDKLAAAIYDVKDKYGEFLYASTAIDEFHDRVALVKTDMMKTVDQHLMPVTGVMRRVIKACKDEWRTRTAAPGTEASGGTPGGSTSGGGGWSSGPGGFDAQPNPDLGAMYNSTLNSNQTPASIGQMMSPGLPGAADATNQAGGGMGPVSETAPVNGYAGQTRTPNIIGAGRNRRRADNTGPAMDLEETFEPSSGNLVPEGNFDGYLAEVEQGAPEKAEQNFIEGGRRHASDHGFMRQDGTCPDCFWASAEAKQSNPEGFAKFKKGDGSMSYADLLKHHHPGGSELGGIGRALGPLITGKARLAFDVYKDYCETNGLRVASIDSLDHYAENLSDAQYFQLASIIQRIGSQPLPGGDKADPGSTGTVSGPSNSYNYGGSAPGWGGAMEQGGVADWQPGTGAFQQNMIAPGQIAASRRQAAGSGKTNYLQKADEALTQVLESKAEEFQETIAPLQQALQVIQQAEQAEQAANPMGVQPPPGTVNVLPGQDPSMGGGDPSMGGGDPSMGGDPMAGGGGDLAQALGLAGAQGMPTPGPEGAQQQITGRRRQARADDIAGYTYDTQNFEPGDLIEYMIAKGELSPGARGMNIEDVLDQHAGGLGIDRHDERSYDSSEHPKVIFESQLDPEYDSDWYSGFREGSRQGGGAYPFVRKGGILDQYNSWLKRRKDLPRGGEADYWAFARENGFGQGEVDSLKKHFQTTAAKVSLSDGEMGSYPRTSGVRGQRSGASPVGGSNRSSSTRESNPSGQGASAQRERKEVSRSKVGREESNVAHSQSGVAGLSGRSQWSSGSSPQRRQAGQSAGESGVRNFRTKLSRYGSAQDSVAAGQNSLSRRASAGRAESDAQSTTPGSSTVSRLRSSKNNDQESSVKFSGSSRHPLSEDNGWGQRLAWTGFGPGIFARKVPGWEFDSHLNGYVTTAARDFTCSCGEKLPVPSYSTCKCGKVHNSYVIGTGGDNHTASIEKYICREIQVRPDVIVANRKAKRHNLTDPGALGDGEEDDLPTMKPVPQDWRRRNEYGQFSAKRR